MNKRQKNILNYVIGPVLFVWLSYSIYNQIEHQTDVRQSWNMILAAFYEHDSWKIYMVIGLMLVNWGIEARKWQLQVKGIEAISFMSAFRAILAGQALGFNTVNRIGESAGRVAFLHNGNRIRGVVLSFVGSMAQIIVTFTMGAVSLWYMRMHILEGPQQLQGLSAFWLDGLIYVIAIGVILFALAYFRLAGLIEVLEKIPFVARNRFFVEKLEDFHWKELTRILLLSFERYLVFIVQYVLLLDVFHVQVNWLDAAALVGVLFLVLAIVPTIALAELGFRGKVGLLLFGVVSSNSVGIIATAAGIWLINLILPAIAGSLFILGVRIFRNNK
ncbi:MAG TPA: lysylphosphatidylglycerol synthase domain-containing protein [Sediminibacterium sp.]|nr:lysylphosphatidylglycerol synthase domain-containing protein [Sediminibacterium sp.]